VAKESQVKLEKWDISTISTISNISQNSITDPFVERYFPEIPSSESIIIFLPSGRINTKVVTTGLVNKTGTNTEVLTSELVKTPRTNTEELTTGIVKPEPRC
jgi:hypothetical protein